LSDSTAQFYFTLRECCPQGYISFKYYRFCINTVLKTHLHPKDLESHSMNKIFKFLSALLLCVAVGCGTSTPSTEITPPPATDAIKMGLQSAAEQGVVDSGLVSVREELEKLKATDAAKAEDLLKDLAQLEKMSGADKIKSKAKDMIKKL
jgi:hypothetical protein